MTLTIEEVFVPGGPPQLTYVDRSELNYENQIRRALRRPHEVLAISGPSKSGKSTLVETVLRKDEIPFISISGSSIDSMDAFWEQVGYYLNVETSQESSRETTKTERFTASAKLGGVIVPAEGGLEVGDDREHSIGRVTTHTTIQSVAVKAKLEATKTVLLIDDFHHAPEGVRLLLAREMKQMIFRGIRVLLLAIPHRLMDLLRTEGELTGRVKHMRISQWAPHDLSRIAMQGFPALNLRDQQGTLTAQLVTESKESPLLMQKLCLQLCDELGIETKQEAETDLRAPAYWPAFYGEVAASIRPAIIEQLRAGAVQRRRRNGRELKSGRIVDLYEAVILGLNALMPKTAIPMSDLSDAMTNLLIDRPAAKRLRQTCERMAAIALEHRGVGDVVLDYVPPPVNTVNVIDPYLAFYLQWGLSDFDLLPDSDGPAD